MTPERWRELTTIFHAAREHEGAERAAYLDRACGGDASLRAELESVLRPGETLTDFVEATVRNAIAFRRVQTAFHARAQAASEEYHRTGVSVAAEAVMGRLQSKLDAKRKKLGR